jgi:lycopene beta-cyclase
VSLDADVVVVGGGPGAWSVACALTQRGVAALVVAPEVNGPWSATYGVWVDEVPAWVSTRASPLGSLFAHEWSTVRVAGHRVREMERPYARLDNEVLRRALGPVTTLEATVRGATHHAWGSRVHTTAGDVVARLVIDATGAAAVLGTRLPCEAAQVAYGVVVPSDAVPHRFRSVSGCTLMDWRPVDGEAVERPGEASFLYVLDDGHLALVEETSLVRRPPRHPDELRHRLTRRLGEDLTEVAVDVELVHIPMAGGRPRHRRGDRVVGFGAAAGYVHPATGYSIGVSLRSATRVAHRLAESLTLDDLAEAAGQVAAAVWPVPQRRVRALHDVGLAALERLDGNGLRAFFDTFFDLPLEQWSGYLQVDGEPAVITRAMTGVFRRLPWQQRWTLMRAHPMGLVHAALPGGS